MSAISKADALETFADLYDVFEDNKAIRKELDKVYDRLNALPSAQPEPCEDAVSRHAAIDAALEDVSDKRTHGFNAGATRAANRIKQLPPAQPEIVRCKDCKHSEHWYRDKRRCFLWVEDGIGVFDDGFCNYAEGRTDGNGRD